MTYHIGQKLKDSKRSYTIVNFRNTNQHSINRDSVWEVKVNGTIKTMAEFWAARQKPWESTPLGSI